MPWSEFNHTGDEPSADQWAWHWARCIEEAAATDIILLLVRWTKSNNSARSSSWASPWLRISAGATWSWLWFLRHHI
jgi:hypothetical protein